MGSPASLTDACSRRLRNQPVVRKAEFLARNSSGGSRSTIGKRGAHSGESSTGQAHRAAPSTPFAGRQVLKRSASRALVSFSQVVDFMAHPTGVQLPLANKNIRWRTRQSERGNRSLSKLTMANHKI